MHRLFALAAGLTLFATAAAAEPIEVRIASHVSELAPEYAQSVLFAKKVEERLPGQFEFKIFPGGQLGKESALIDGVQLGVIEMVDVASGVLKLDSKLGLFDLPWLFDSREHVERAMAKGLEEAVRRRIESKADVKVIGIYENGFRHVIDSRNPIVEPADMAGMKVRISGGKFRQGVFESLGAVPAKVAWGETFTAMQTGVVDGAEAAIYGFYEQKMQEVQKYLSLTKHVYTPSFLMASKSFFDRLTQEQQKVFIEVGREITEQSYRDAAALEDRYLADMKGSIAVNEVDLPAFQQATRPVYQSYIEANGKDWIDLVDAAR
ncbi:tripartite ATP-independent transporter solute receptor, DctP family [Tistlia consotensis]|uniref:Tripartite ATP-independent transporter solute receptor, DctP family n=1 Tax=Tistlia consotensis USBA 355 TaxID=560819 RepID=A0A1Y6B5Q7_9PROT|nr:TRAP transporter substrate-binding protein [Tistlia consotensis]SME93689.1 tripartite ATP-independent transporter solute receptor, DctP family [Tistlia consotensis USBA 355]SNR28744.1 tripartite ATP-independent transporter solute receptor, DctP family [Tistlia consotensis]